MCAEFLAPCICRIRGCWCQSCSDVCITPWQLANDPCCRSNCPQQRVQGFLQWLTSSISKKISVISQDVNMFQVQRHMCVHELRRGMKTAEKFQNHSSNNMLSLTPCESAAQNACFDVFLKSVLLLNHYGALCIARWLAQQLVASLLLPKEPPKFPESTESLGKSVDSPFCLLRPALGWMQMINFQHPHAFLAEKCYSLPGRWVSTHATWRWGGQNLSSFVLLQRKKRSKRERQMITGI